MIIYFNHFSVTQNYVLNIFDLSRFPGQYLLTYIGAGEVALLSQFHKGNHKILSFLSIGFKNIVLCNAYVFMGFFFKSGSSKNAICHILNYFLVFPADPAFKWVMPQKQTGLLWKIVNGRSTNNKCTLHRYPC